MLGKIGGSRRRGQQRKRWLDGITDSGHELEQTPSDSVAERPDMLQSVGTQHQTRLSS